MVAFFIKMMITEIRRMAAPGQMPIVCLALRSHVHVSPDLFLVKTFPWHEDSGSGDQAKKLAQRRPAHLDNLKGGYTFSRRHLCHHQEDFKVRERTE